MRRNILCVLAIVVFFSAELFPQSVYLHPSHEVYDFLKRMEGKQALLGYRDVVLPLTRGDIARDLIKVDEHRKQLTQVERNELDFLKEEFYLELKNLKYKQLPDERWHLYRYRSDTTAAFNLDVVGGYSDEKLPFGETYHTRTNGLMLQGYAGNWFGAYVYVRDNQDGGSYLPYIWTQLGTVNYFLNTLSPQQGQIPTMTSSQNQDYDFVDAQANFDVSFLTLSLEKMPNVWGEGYAGNLILSSKPPSYPQIKLRAKLGKDVDFTYLHAWLSSDIVDSVNSYHYPYGLSNPIYRTVYKQKYLASHILEMSPWNGVDVALGESEVYGGRNPELIYLIPFMFFKAAEHYNTDEDNSQMFASIDLNIVKDYEFYSTLYIDEFSTETFYRTDRQRNQLGFTVGTRAYDLFYPNTDLIVEYTRTNPWVYNHKYPDATYQNHGYDLGDWIGQNADLFFVQGNYRPLRNLKLSIQFESLRKGGKEATHYQYELPTPEFLYGPEIKEQSYGIAAQYEPLRDLFADFHLLVSRYTQGVPQTASDGTPIFQYQRISNDYAGKIDFFLALRYNFQ
ncbi:MAG: hypothetical protein KGJ59_11390 [Bacteroidota bacterium]|nr:hypothetical protein [Bacteroidota bacterium]